MLCAHLIYLDPVTISFFRKADCQKSQWCQDLTWDLHSCMCFSINLGPIQHRGPNEQLQEVRTGF